MLLLVGTVLGFLVAGLALQLDVGLALTESEHEKIVSGQRIIKVRPLTAWLCGITD